MVLMWLCGLVFLGALALGVRWSGRTFVVPPPADPLTPGEFTRRYVRSVAITITGGVVGGLVTIGAGGRLAMRFLAVTAGDAAQGRITEADEVVGEITTDGTIGFVLFNGIFGGLLVATIYLVLRRVFPGGLVGGAAYGLALLVVLGTILEPLRKDNPDFDLVGPGWFAVALFTVLALATGVVVHGFAARLSAAIPLIEAKWSVLARYLPAAVLLAMAFPLLLVIVPLYVVSLLASRWRELAREVRGDTWVQALRILFLVVVAVSLPGAFVSVVDIVGR